MTNRYFVKLHGGAKEVSNRYGIPYTTVVRWKREQNNLDSQKGYTYDKLSLIASLEIDAENKIKKLFSENETSMLFSAFKNKAPSKELFLLGGMEFLFFEYCYSQKIEDNNVSDRLKTLSRFEKFVLLEYLYQK